MSELTDNFINAIAPLAISEYLKRDRWVLPSVVIAFAAKESGWNINAKTLFGIKSDGVGADVESLTSEYYNGVKVDGVKAAWESYPSIGLCVAGFFDYLFEEGAAWRYTSIVNCTDYRSAIFGIRHGGYATAPAEEYIDSLCDIIEQFDLTRFDVARGQAESTPEEIKSESGIVVGSKVIVIDNMDYHGDRFDVYYDQYDVIEVNGDRVVIGIGDSVTCAISVTRIALPEQITNSTVVHESTELKMGDRVEVLDNNDYNGNRFTLWYGVYDLMEVSGDRAVIGIDGTVTAAINVCNIRKI